MTNEDAIIAETAALEALLEANEGQGPEGRAKALAREARRLLATPSTIEEHVLDISLAHILATSPQAPLPKKASKGPWIQETFETIALAWSHWVAYQDRRAIGLTESLRRDSPTSTPHQEDNLTHEVLYLWSQAVESLVEGDEAQRTHNLFQEALELGGSIGFEYLSTIHWTFGATFFHPSETEEDTSPAGAPLSTKR